MTVIFSPYCSSYYIIFTLVLSITTYKLINYGKILKKQNVTEKYEHSNNEKITEICYVKKMSEICYISQQVTKLDNINKTKYILA